jgi:hypothetical protein
MATSTTVITAVAPAQTAPQPTAADLSGLIHQLESSLVARISVRRQSKDDLGWRQIYVSLDDERIAVLAMGEEVTREVRPGRHRLRVHNTLFWRTCDFEVSMGEHVSFSAINRAGPGTWSIAFFIGTNPIYLTLARDVHAS